MEKKTIIAVFLIALTVTLSFIPFNNKREIIIKAQLYDVAKQINDLNNWKRWDSDISNSNIKISGDYTTDQTATLSSGQYYLLHHINPLTVSLVKNFSNASAASSSLISIYSSENDSATHVSWSETVTIYKLIERSFTKINSRQNNLENLKRFMEDVNYKYGFFIRLVPVKDTLILTAKTKAVENSSAHTIAYLYNLLQSFISKHNIPSEKKYFYTTGFNNDEIAVGIPVYKKTASDNNIKFLALPAKGRLVEGDYKGSYADKQDIYKAINNFMLGQHLKQVAQPFEKYNVADTILQPGTNVNIKIYYPVF